MRSLFAVLAVILAFSTAPRTASAQALAVHQAVPASPAAPAKPPASTIIPGTPLAALAGVSAPVDTDADTPTPFGTDHLGLSVMTQVADEAGGTVSEFAQAIRQSTRLTPVIQWLASFGSDVNRQNHAAEAAIGLLLTLVPALLVEAAVNFGLKRPRAGILRLALARRQADVPAEPDGLVAAESGETEKRLRARLSLLAWFRRLGLSLVYIFLALLPLIAFALTGASLLAAGIIVTKSTHLIVVGAANTYLLCRVIAEALRFIYAPGAPDLRLIHTTNRRARWVTRSIIRLVTTAAAGYIIVSAGEILGLPKNGGMALTRLIALAVHIQLAIFVWQGRRIVAGWIRGKPDQAGIISGLRQRLASIWHYLALFYIVALWIAYAAGVQNAFGVLLRIIAVLIGAMVLGRLVWLGSGQLLDRALSGPKTPSQRPHSFHARARVYHPLVKLLVRVILGAVIAIFALQGWGLNVLPWLLKDPLSRVLVCAAISILITIAAALLIWELSNAFLDSRIDRLAAAGHTRQASRLRTLLPMLKASLGVTIGLVAGLVCLSKIGLNAAPLLAGAGVLGIAIGFGSQKLVQDIITGLFLLLEDAMQVGDVITLAGMSGTVERLSLRTIRLRGGDGSINIIPFSAVTTVTNQTRDFGYAQISINVGYNENIDHVSAVLTDIARAMRAEAAWGAMMREDLQLNGLDAFGPNALIITGQIRTGPGQHWAVRREFYRRVLLRFAVEKIEIPYSSGNTTLTLDSDEFSQLVALARPGKDAPATAPHPPAHGAGPGGASAA